MNFLVYEHWRPDTGVCFYVGKGKLKRAKSFEARNNRYARIVSKLAKLGLKPQIRILRDRLTEDQAFALEIATIAYWRKYGVSTANYTDGGDGTSGRSHSEKTREKIRQRATGRRLSVETIAKMSAARTGMRRSIETRKKQSEAAKIAQKTRFERLKQSKTGRLELKRRMTAISKKAAANPKLRALRSANAKALWSDPTYRQKMKQRRCVCRPVVKGFS